MPNGSGEKAKGAILCRAVQYIHHLNDGSSDGRFASPARGSET